MTGYKSTTNILFILRIAADQFAADLSAMLSLLVAARNLYTMLQTPFKGLFGWNGLYWK